MSEYARDVLVLAATAVALVVAIIVTAQGMAGEAPAKGHRSSGVVKEMQLPTLPDSFGGDRLPSMTTKEAHGG